MTLELDDLDLFAEPDDTAEQRIVVLEREPKRCRHPRDRRQKWADGTGRNGWICDCGHTVTALVLRRGKSSRRLGGDTERRIEKVYGPVKIGERGDPVDHLGRVWRWQSKATRALPPLWLAAISEPTSRLSIPFAAAHQAMDGLYGTRRSVVIRSFVSRGIRTRDWLFIDAFDAQAEFGLAGIRWYVIPGDWWLDHFGRDDGAVVARRDELLHPGDVGYPFDEVEGERR